MKHNVEFQYSMLDFLWDTQNVFFCVSDIYLMMTDLDRRNN